MLLSPGRVVDDPVTEPRREMLAALKKEISDLASSKSVVLFAFISIAAIGEIGEGSVVAVILGSTGEMKGGSYRDCGVVLCIVDFIRDGDTIVSGPLDGDYRGSVSGTTYSLSGKQRMIAAASFCR